MSTMSDNTTTVIENARIVLANTVIERGYIAIAGGLITEIGEGQASERGIDAGGDLLLPGLVELHTDHLEAHVMPRPRVHWDTVAAVISYDAQIATSGITTVLDSLRVWREEGAEEVDGQAPALSQAFDRARDAGLLRIEHFLHLRCEVPMPKVVDDAAELIGRADVRLLSLMDHTPGQRQFRDPQKLRDYYRGKTGGMSDAELDILFARRVENHANYAAENYKGLIALAATYKTPLASHDDTTAEHVEQAVQDRVAIAEFREAAGPVDDPMHLDICSRRAGVERIQIEIVAADIHVLLDVQIAITDRVESDGARRERDVEVHPRPTAAVSAGDGGIQKD
jgi:alpha-D-ribose 1-methylphosphonate 5-triphosphate diphosphatase